MHIKGTLGVLVEAKKKGQVERVGPIVHDLQRQGFRAGANLVRRVLAEAGE